LIDNTLTQAQDEAEEKEETQVNINDPFGIMSSDSFSSLGLFKLTSKAIADMDFHLMTQVTLFLHFPFLFD